MKYSTGVSGPIARLHALMNAGYDNPALLLTRIFGLDESILPTNVSSLWSIVFSILSEPVQRRRLRQYSTLDAVVDLLSSSSRILVLTGAGISVSCGIPDFRSRDGVYARLAKDFPDLNSPQAMFEMDFFMQNPYPFFKFAKVSRWLCPLCSETPDIKAELALPCFEVYTLMMDIPIQRDHGN